MHPKCKIYTSIKSEHWFVWLQSKLWDSEADGQRGFTSMKLLGPNYVKGLKDTRIPWKMALRSIHLALTKVLHDLPGVILIAQRCHSSLGWLKIAKLTNNEPFLPFLLCPSSIPKIYLDIHILNNLNRHWTGQGSR